MSESEIINMLDFKDLGSDLKVLKQMPKGTKLLGTIQEDGSFVEAKNLKHYKFSVPIPYAGQTCDHAFIITLAYLQTKGDTRWRGKELVIEDSKRMIVGNHELLIRLWTTYREGKRIIFEMSVAGY